MGSSRPDDSAQRAQIVSNRETMNFIKQQAKTARGDIQSIFPQALSAQRQGFQSGLNVLEEGFPQQQQQFQQGNVAGQQALIDAQPGIEAALLGGVAAPPGTGPTQPFVGDLTQLTQQQLPNTPVPIGMSDPRQPQIPFDIAQLLAGLQ